MLHNSSNYHDLSPIVFLRSRNQSPKAYLIEHETNGRSIELHWNSSANWVTGNSAKYGRGSGTTPLRSPSRLSNLAPWTRRTSLRRRRSWRSCGTTSWFSCTLCARWRNPSTSSRSWWRMAPCWITCKVGASLTNFMTKRWILFQMLYSVRYYPQTFRAVLINRFLLWKRSNAWRWQIWYG